MIASLLSNPLVIGAIAVLIAAFGGWQRIAGGKAERNKNAAKERDSYAKHLQEIADAANARPAGKLSDDPNNRDR